MNGLCTVPRKGTTVAAVILLFSAGCLQSPDASAPGATNPELPLWQEGDYWNYYYRPDKTWINLTVVGQEEKSGFDTYVVSEERSETGSGTVRPVRYWIDVQTLGTVGAAEANGAEYTSNCASEGIFPLEHRHFNCTTEFHGYRYHSKGEVEPVGWDWMNLGDESFWSVTLWIQGRSWGPGTDMPIDEKIHFAPRVGNLLFTEGESCQDDMDGVTHCSLVEFELRDWNHTS